VQGYRRNYTVLPWARSGMDLTSQTREAAEEDQEVEVEQLIVRQQLLSDMVAGELEEDGPPLVWPYERFTGAFRTRVSINTSISS
jgi:hypothetical protein